MQTDRTALFRNLPQLGDLLQSEPFLHLQAQHARSRVRTAARAELDLLRDDVRAGTETEDSIEHRLQQLADAVAARLQRTAAPSLRRVLNATGVILQTNLGRAPLSADAIARVSQVASGYSNLEFNLQTGERGRRDVHAEQLILHVLADRGNASADTLSGKAAAVVNNCAAATFLALNTLADRGEVIVSRGELVEIGGGFRVPDILQKSGATLREVGTTNRTRIADYAEAITPATRLILRVHRSNFRIDGFTEQPSLQQLIELGKQAALPVFEDQGTGSVTDLEDLGIFGESSWIASACSELSLVACSGDKLLGGPQCGILVGAREHIEQIRRNPLYRVLRADKMTYAALEATLQAYLQRQENTIPAVAMMHMPPEQLRLRCEALVQAITHSSISAQVVRVESVIGGGTTPGAVLPGFAVAIHHAFMPEQQVAAALRSADPPVITRTHKGTVLLDLRTIAPEDDVLLQRLVTSALLPETSQTASPSAHA